jgi:chromosome segregation ATPase
MIDSVPILVFVPLGAMLAGLLGGWLVRGSRNSAGVSGADWRIRLEARDRDLREAEARLAALVGAIAALDGDMTAADRLVALEEELERADEELDRLRALAVDRDPASGSVARRLEELEVELATLESMKCPEPAAHRRARAERS